MTEQTGLYVLTFLLGYGLLWLCWAVRCRPFTRQQIARGIVLGFAGILVALLVVETANYGMTPAWWQSASTGFGL